MTTEMRSCYDMCMNEKGTKTKHATTDGERFTCVTTFRRMDGDDDPSVFEMILGQSKIEALFWLNAKRLRCQKDAYAKWSETKIPSKYTYRRAISEEYDPDNPSNLWATMVFEIRREFN